MNPMHFMSLCFIAFKQEQNRSRRKYMRDFAVMRSSDAPRHISPEELCAYTERAMYSARQFGKPIPPIIVMHVSESVAAVVGVERAGVIRHNRSSSTGVRSYYEVWLVGQAALTDYVLALQGILDDLQN